MAAQWRNKTNAIGLLILRLGVGAYMASHGWMKAQWVMAGDFDNFGDPIGIGPTASLILVAFAEFVCPIIIILGFATRLAAIPIVIAMGVAAFVAHGGDPWTMQPDGPSKEPALMFLIPYLALVFTGAGAISIDGLIASRKRKPSA
jgi:putative oxidoreductase